jgi:hypothetical protein
MGAFKLLTVLYMLMFAFLILVIIGSVFGVFDNPLLDPGM